jgi:hypothetical protein
MLPSFTINDAMDLVVVYSVLTPQFSLRIPLFALCAYLSNQLLGQFCTMTSNAFSSAPSLCHVLHVLGVRTLNYVSPVNAERNIAGMPGKWAWPATIVEVKYGAVGSDCLFVKTNTSITMHRRKWPNQAFVRMIGVSDVLKPLQHRYGILYKHLRSFAARVLKQSCSSSCTLLLTISPCTP